MKRNYMKPSLLVEKFTTEEIMDRENVLSSIVLDSQSPEGAIHFDSTPGNNNVLNSIDYRTFGN